MNLTTEQIQTVRTGEPVRLTPPEVGADCVLIRADVYERVKNLLYDDSASTEDELRRMLAQSAEGNGWNEPEMDAYDRYDEEKR